MSETLIKAEKVSKKFCLDLKRSLWYGMKDLAGDLLCLSANSRGHLREDEFWAVRDVTFELKRGACLGLIGPNGAGKTTLLRMLNGLINPDEGRIEMRGRIGALIALGAGFNPILTGRENIFVNAAVLGLSKKEIDNKFDQIVAFSELEAFIDSPVQNYSSGMAVRLGFAVASAVEPDILLIDEVLAVGDINFVLKCFSRIDKILPNTAVIFVTHNMPQIERICTSLLVLKSGRAVYQGEDVHEGLNAYYAMFPRHRKQFCDSESTRLIGITLESGSRRSDDSNGQVFTMDCEDELNVFLDLEIDRDVSDIQIIISFVDQMQKAFGAIYSKESGISIDCTSGKVVMKVIISEMRLSQGLYAISVACKKGGTGQVLFRHQSAAYFQVGGKIHGWVPVIFPAKWKQLNL